MASGYVCPRCHVFVEGGYTDMIDHMEQVHGLDPMFAVMAAQNAIGYNTNPVGDGTQASGSSVPDYSWLPPFITNPINNIITLGGNALNNVNNKYGYVLWIGGAVLVYLMFNKTRSYFRR